MQLFLEIFLQIFPLFGIVLLGYISVKYSGVSLDTLGKMILYVINPVIFFHGAYFVDAKVEYLFLPLIYFLLATAMGFFFLWVGKFFWDTKNKDGKKMAHLLGYTAGASNVGFMGYPLIIMIFGDEYFALATMIVMGFAIYENSTGLFIAANGKYSVKNSLIKVLKMPTLYAFSLGLFLNFLDISLLESITATTQNFKGAYTVVGMMIIGAGLANISFSSFAPKLIPLSLITRLIIWPAIVLGLVFLDSNFLDFYSEKIYTIALFLSLMPLAGSTVAFANEFDMFPKKASVAVSISLFVSVVTIPLYWIFFSGLGLVDL